eukprot:scaffold61502_cov43-Tisochrysis_lutea.AAC.1
MNKAWYNNKTPFFRAGRHNERKHEGGAHSHLSHGQGVRENIKLRLQARGVSAEEGDGCAGRGAERARSMPNPAPYPK